MVTARQYVAQIRDVNGDSIALVGGKGANLGALTHAGLPVPEAFCVTTEAYRAFIDENDLGARIESDLRGINYEDVTSIGEAAQRVRNRITEAPIPSGISESIRTAYTALEAKLGQGLAVAVRSSATAEDLPGTSFAGQQDTYLNICGIDNVIEHIKRCWASLWTDRAISYRQRQGFKHEDVYLAVVVQEMFPSDVAGVMFTINPLTSNPREIFINASWGLGEAIVSGRVNPDQYICSKSPARIIEKLINDKAVMTAPRKDGQGSEEIDVPRPFRNAQALTDEQIIELGDIGRRIEQYYGFPQDIEWGLSKGRFALLQSREVTGIDVDFPEGIEAYQTPGAFADIDNERWVWSRAYSDEVQTGPSTPYFYSQLQFGMTTLKNNFLEYTDTEEFLGFTKDTFKNIPMFRWYGARAYYNLAFERERIRRFIPPFARDDAALWPFPAEEREEIRKMAFNWPRFLTTLWNIHNKRPRVSLLESQQIMFENVAKWKDHEDRVWADVDFDTAPARRIIDLYFDLRNGTGWAENVCLPFTIYLFMLPAALRKLCEDWCDDKDGTVYGALVSGLSTKTGEENIAIWNLAQSVKKSPTLIEIALSAAPLDQILGELEASPDAAEFSVLFSDFIKQYGHRGGAERDAIHPRYRHQPARVLLPVRSMLLLDEDSSPAAVEHKLAARMQETRARCLQELRKGPMGFIRAPIFGWFVELVQQWMYYRDFERWYNDKTMARPRDFVQALGRRFVKRGIVKEVDDAFFLSKDELIWADESSLSPRDVQNRVRGRRRVYERYSEREPPKYIQGWRTFDDETLSDDGQGLRGIGASRGVVTGRARVCRKLEEIGKVEKGDILVTVATDPGWTTVFSFIGGVVVESGGVVAHAVLISREYGLPCVANLAQACVLIPDGAIITVDGGTGRVVIHADDESAG